MDKLILTWNDILVLTQKLADKVMQTKNPAYTSLYGIPRGGINVAQELSKYTSLPLVTEPEERKTLIVDDVVDSGRTIKPFVGKNDIAVLHEKPNAAFKATYKVEKTDKWIVYPWEARLGGEQEGIQDNVARILEYIGEDPNREGLVDTPKRVEKAYGELFAGYKQDPKEVLARRFDANGYDEMVVLKDIEFYSFCEHHILPFYGTVDIGYIPADKVVGISKLARLVEVYARRLQIQERMTEQIAEAIMNDLGALGVGVRVRAKHMCMVARGIKKQNSVMVTSKLLGAIFEKPESRQEFLRLIDK